MALPSKGGNLRNYILLFTLYSQNYRCYFGSIALQVKLISNI